MIKSFALAVVSCAAGGAMSVQASDLKDAGRFCGYGPIIDLRPGEAIKTRYGGMHGGGFEWTGPFGLLTVDGVQWAARPKGRQVGSRTALGHIRFVERRVKGTYTIAIWNGRQGAAYFRSEASFTKQQREAIDRVDLIQEGEQPQGCSLRTVFSWE